MRTASILLALVVVLGFVSEAGAQSATTEIRCEYDLRLGSQKIGFADYEWRFDMDDVEPTDTWTILRIGPLGDHQVPFTATQGLVGFCVIVVGLVAMVTVGTVRWKRKAS